MPRMDAWKCWAMAISLPSSQTWALLETFWALKGATLYPWSWRILAMTKVIVDFPASLEVPNIDIFFKVILKEN